MITPPAGWSVSFPTFNRATQDVYESTAVLIPPSNETTEWGTPFLVSLEGPQGEPGPKGETGPPGVSGSGVPSPIGVPDNHFLSTKNNAYIVGGFQSDRALENEVPVAGWSAPVNPVSYIAQGGTNTVTEGLEHVAYGNNIFVGTGRGNSVYTSNDGVTWTERTAPTIPPPPQTIPGGTCTYFRRHSFL